MSDRADAVDLAVVIPTRDRWPILERTLAALATQTVTGFETVVVVDGTDQRPPPGLAARVLVRERGGPGAARNLGARSTERRLILFIGDDTIPAPDLVERHLAAHAAHPGRDVAVLGRVEWHPEVARDRLARWLDWSGTQFDYRSLDGQAGQDVGYGRFYTANVSLHRHFFLDAGGFDEDFFFLYEDIDCGLRLAERGMRLLYEPSARVLHLHRYEWDGVVRRFRTVAGAERQMLAKHEWFPAHFRNRVEVAAARPKASALWPLVVDAVPRRWRRLRRAAERRADTRYYQRLAPDFLAAWDEAGPPQGSTGARGSSR